MKNITVTEQEGKIAYLMLKKVFREKGIFGKVKLNEVKRNVVQTAEELGVEPEELYALARRINNELLVEARYPEVMDFSKQG
jgi:predicted hydrolase (HD superfamily)